MERRLVDDGGSRMRRRTVPIKGGWVPEEQANTIVSNIINYLSGGIPHSGKPPANRPRHYNRGERGGGEGGRE